MDVLLAVKAAPAAHGVSGAAGWADEIISFGLIVGIIVALIIMSRSGRRKRNRTRDKD